MKILIDQLSDYFGNKIIQIKLGDLVKYSESLYLIDDYSSDTGEFTLIPLTYDIGREILTA